MEHNITEGLASNQTRAQALFPTEEPGVSECPMI
jgi:hypothetical protein